MVLTTFLVSTMVLKYNLLEEKHNEKSFIRASFTFINTSCM